MGRGVLRRVGRLPCGPLAVALPIALAFPSQAASAEGGPALPSGGTVVGGQAQILAPAAGQLLIDQHTARAVIDWRSFSIGEGGRVHFQNGSGATLNRVLGGDPSRIAGLLSATGSVWLVNPAGVLVSPDGQVTTGGSFIASTRSIAPAAFMAGGGLLEGSSAAGLENDGRIEAGGDVVLIGRLVENRGSVKAGANARLISAERIVLHEAGADGRVHVEIAPEAGAEGAVRNSGRIEAAVAELRAVGGNVYALAADTGGVVRATGVAHEGGRILLVGDAGVTVGGTLDASGTTGGAIDVTGSGIAVQSGARILAGGTSGDGGTIRVGGALKGGPGLAPADRLLVEVGALVDVSSVDGRGGTAILWSEQWTRFEGLIRADGGLGGGFVETSSRGALGIENGRVEVGNGDWLLDPRDVIIATGGFNPGAPYPNPFIIAPPNAAGAYTVSRSALQNALNLGSNVTVTTEQPARTDLGNITVSASVSWTGPGSLTLRADNSIAVNAAISSTGTGSLTLLAGATNSAGSITTSATLTMAHGAITMTAPGSISIGGSVSLSNTGSLSATAGSNITVGGAINAAAASSGSVLLDAGNALQLNTGSNLQGSASFRGIGRGSGISFAGSGNRTFRTGTGALTLEAPGANGDIVIGRNANLVGNFQLLTGGGALTVTAGRDIRLVSSPFANGRWTSVGSISANIPISLSAGRDVTWEVGNFADNFVEVVTSGTLSVSAGRAINQQPSTLSPARLQGHGTSVTLTAPSATLNGLVESRGETLLQGGAFSFGTTSPLFTLNANRNFTLTAGSTITSASALNISTTGTGDIAFGGAVSGTTLQATAGDEVRIGAPIQMSGSGNAILLGAGVRLVNLAGQSLRAPNGRWLTYSVSPFNDIGWQDLNPDAPNLYGRTLGFLPPVSSPGTGNRRLYSFVPVLTLTGDSPTKTYGQSGPALGFSVSGLVPGDSLATALVSGTATVTSSGTPATAPVGTYATVVAAQATAQGYQLNLVSGTLTVDPAPLIVRAAPQTRQYGTTDPTLTFTANGFVNGESASVLSGVLVRAPGENVGVYAIGQGTLSAANYSISFVGADFTITRAPLSVTAIAQTREYGIGDPTFTFSASGFLLSDTASTALTGALARAPGENVGLYAIGQGTLAAQNYSISFVPGSLSITPAPLSIVADPGRKTYGQPDPTLTFAASGFRLGDTVASLSGSLARDPGEDVGAYAITQGSLANPNYSISFNGGTFTIDPATLRVVATAATKVYGDPDPALGFVATGFQFADTAQTVITGALDRAPGETVAGSPYTIGPGTLAAGPNYVIAFESAPFTISRRLLTLAVVGSVSRTYDATVTATLGSGNLRLSGVLPGDTVAATAASAAFDTPDVGTGKLVTASGVTLSGAAAGNYAVAPSASGAIGTITPAPLVAVALDAQRPFGVANPPLLLSLSGLMGADTAQSIGLAAVTNAGLRSPPGPYVIDVSGNPRNYSVTRVSGILTVLPIPGLVQFVPELIEVPALGGYIQNGIGAGVTAISDTLLAARPVRAEDVVRGSRFTVSLQPSPPVGDSPAGASVFEGAGTSP